MYGVWSKPEDIDFVLLPEKFALKMNTGSGNNIIVQDKAQISKMDIIKKFNTWIAKNYYYGALEWQYKDIEPKIICEEYLDGVAEDIEEFDIFCFNGKAEYIWCIKESHKPNCSATIYDRNWNNLNVSYGYPLNPLASKKPKNMEKMIELAEELSHEFKHVRVDFYNLPDGRILFGEMTFSSWAGFKHFIPEEYDYIFGEYIGKDT